MASNTVTREMRFGKIRIQWNVGCTSGSGIKGVLLTVFRADMLFRGQRIGVYAVKDMPFPDRDSAYSWAFQRGYLQESFKREWCREHRELHTFIGKPTPICFESLKKSQVSQ